MYGRTLGIQTLCPSAWAMTRNLRPLSAICECCFFEPKLNTEYYYCVLTEKAHEARQIAPFSNPYDRKLDSSASRLPYIDLVPAVVAS